MIGSPVMNEARHDVFVHAKKMWEAGLVVGSAGNVSRRVDAQHIAITPTSVPYDSLTVDDIVVVDIASGEAVDSQRAASYELPMHLVVYRSRPDVGAIVHTHSPYVTTLSVLHKPLPPVIDEMVVYFGGTVEVADYAFTGTEQLGTNVVRALNERRAARQSRQRLHRPRSRARAAHRAGDGVVRARLRAGARHRRAGRAAQRFRRRRTAHVRGAPKAVIV
jgi:ribulose-5-phosphate 4-epimerase/fuculose-1-phosphate aldolase